jgi:6-phosphogluconolactonase
MNELILYIGSYSAANGDGIYIFKMNKETGSLLELSNPVKVSNPSYIIISSDRRNLYAVLETREYDNQPGGGVASFHIRENGTLELINSKPTGGYDPCYLCQDSSKEYLFTANYSSGSITAFPIESAGTINDSIYQVKHSGKSINVDRQEGPHMHCVTFTPDGKYLCAVDLGIDEVRFYSLDHERKELVLEKRLTIPVKEGSGPRHITFSREGRFAYIIQELSCEVSVYEYNGESFKHVQTVSTLPEDYQGINTSAAIKISNDGQFLYASNRGHNSIALYRVGENGLLDRIGIYSCGGIGPRDFTLTPDGEFVLIANEGSNEVVVYRRNPLTGAIEDEVCRESIHKPVCIQFM